MLPTDREETGVRQRLPGSRAVESGGIGTWVAIGLGTGAAIGVATGDLAVWLPLGTGIGAAVGVVFGPDEG